MTDSYPPTRVDHGGVTVRRFAVAAGVFLLLLIAAVGATMALPLSYDERQEFDSDLPDEPHASEAEVRIDGEVVMAAETSVSADGDAARMLQKTPKDDGGTVETEWYWGGGDVHHMRSVAEEPYVLQQIVDRESVVNATVDEADGQAVVVDGDVDPRLQDIRTSWHELIVANVGLTTYEHVNTRTVDGSEVYVYEPEPGWFEAAYRITNASGVVHVDAATGEVRHADVTFDRTRAETYLEYLSNRDDTATMTIRYDRSAPPADLERPDWAIEHRDEEDGSQAEG